MKHISVLLNETIDSLNIKEDGIYVDCTLGYAGHSSAILKRLKKGKLYAFDQDEEARNYSENVLKQIGNNFEIIPSNFVNLKDAGDPVEIAKEYDRQGADELVFYDITASAEGRKLFTDILTEVAKTIFIPLTVGGGINTLDDFDRVLKCGADKVSVNSGAIKNPNLIYEAAKRYGDQCVVLSVDVKRVDGTFRVFAKGGRENTGMEAIEWIRRCVGMGAGEVVLNSMDTDGVKRGFDLEMLDAVCRVVDVPVIASGGAGKEEDFITLFKSLPKVDAGLAASIFHFHEVDINDLKRELSANGIPMRI